MPVLPAGVVLGHKSRQKTVYFTANGSANASTLFKITSSTTKTHLTEDQLHGKSLKESNEGFLEQAR